MSSPKTDGSSTILRLSCEQCRQRKLKCDRAEPRCTRCVKLGDACVYPRARKRPGGGKRRLGIKDLETRLAQLEGELENAKKQDFYLLQGSDTDITSGTGQYSAGFSPPDAFSLGNNTTENTPLSQLDSFSPNELLAFDVTHGVASLQIRQELVDVYFDKVHPITPILHPDRYRDSLHGDDFLRPPMCLQNIVSALAASNSDNHSALALSFYHQAKTCVEHDESKGRGDQFMTLAHVQTWLLMANFEAQQTMFTRASSSQCRGLRLAQMLELHQLDQEASSSSTLEPTQWSLLEEQRRTWWAIYCTDRFLYGTTGWPSLVEDEDIYTLLPASEDAFEKNIPEDAFSLRNLIKSRNQGYSPLAGRVLVAHLFYKTMRHTFHSKPETGQDAIEYGKHWETHRQLDNDLSMLLLSFPSPLKLPRSFQYQNATFVNIMVHTAVICLNRSAIAQLHKSPESPEYLLSQCQARIITATEQMVGIFRMVSDLQSTFKNPVIAFSSYMAALVYLEDYTVTQSHRSRDGLEFLFNIISLFSKSNTVANSLSQQLASDMQQHGIHTPLVDQVNSLMQCTMLAPLLGRAKPNSSSFVFNPLA